VDAINHALRGIRARKCGCTVCWGSFHGPHKSDIPLKDIVDIIFRVRASSYSIEASNPVHEHEWRVFEEVKPPEGAVLIPGVVGHCCDFIEHPELVAQRLLRTRSSSAARTSWAGPTAVWARASEVRRSPGRSSRRSRRARASRANGLWMRPAKPSKKRAPARKKKGKKKAKR